MSNTATRIRTTREARGLSQAALAKLVGVSQGTIGHIESGRSDTSKHLVQIAAALNVSAEWLQTGRGSASTGWPFSNIDQARFDRLSLEEKRDVETQVEIAITMIEKRDSSTKSGATDRSAA